MEMFDWRDYGNGIIAFDALAVFQADHHDGPGYCPADVAGFRDASPEAARDLLGGIRIKAHLFRECREDRC